MQRAIGILLILWFAAIGSGAVMYVHELDHAREDAAVAQAAKDKGLPEPAHPDHNDDNCAIHAQLHMPLLSLGWTPILICLGLWVAFVSELRPPLIAQNAPRHTRGRSPPAA